MGLAKYMMEWSKTSPDVIERLVNLQNAANHDLLRRARSVITAYTQKTTVGTNGQANQGHVNGSNRVDEVNINCTIKSFKNGKNGKEKKQRKE